jgi:hypothetical protein
MKTLTMTAILSIMFLSAGAFAGDSHTLISTAPARVENITVMVKNQAWPAAGRISVEPCKLNRCIDI